MNILLGVCGTVEADKTDQLLKMLCDFGSVRLITTKSAKAFIQLPSGTLSKIERFADADEMGKWIQRGDPILHVELTRWADVLIIAPLTANTLAKIVCGMADNLLTEVARSFSREKPFIVAPALTKEMFGHPLTTEHLKKITDWGIHVVSATERSIATEYSGAMAELSEILLCFKCKTVAQ